MVGKTGLMQGLVIIALANAISVITSISLSAVATNLKVKGGGDYYLISRTLGLEFGGALGLVLFLAQSVSIGFYCLGFGEVIAGMLNFGSAWQTQAVAFGAVACLFVLAWLGADVATKFQFVVMAVLVASLISFFWGGSERFSLGLLKANWSSPGAGALPFWVAFALFFPAVTGFTQGVSMSGDLKDPGKSLPLGTFFAVGLSIVVYFAVAIVFAGSLSLSALSSDYMAMKKVSTFAAIIDAGVIAATLSSAMASFMGAPRILQSLAGDKIFPWLNPFSVGHGPANNPRRGVLLSLVLALLTVGMGELNLIAPVVSMFFLISYGLLNYATYFESGTQSPSFRPRFHWFNSRLSLAGGLACLGCMLAIDPWAGLAASAVMFGIHQYLRRSNLPSRWADSKRSHQMHLVRENLLAAFKEPDHARNWSPQILALSDDRDRRIRLCTFASWLEGNSGLTTVMQIVEAQGRGLAAKRAKSQEVLAKELRLEGMAAFPLVVAGPDVADTMEVALQAYGAGPLKANLVLVNWPVSKTGGNPGLSDLRYGKSLAAVYRLGLNLMVLKASNQAWEELEQVPSEKRRIDVWWFGESDSAFLLLMAYLITRSRDWDGAEIRALCLCQEEDGDEMVNAAARAFSGYRIDAKPVAIKGSGIRAMLDASRDASLVLINFDLRDNTLVGPLGVSLPEIAYSLPLAAFAMPAREIDLEAEPEEGQVAQVARTLDKLERRRDLLKMARAKADKAKLEAKDKQQQFQEPDTIFQGEMFERLRDAVEAQESAASLEQRVERAQALFDEAMKTAREMGVSDKEED